jgi:hypothetical protein
VKRENGKTEVEEMEETEYIYMQRQQQTGERKKTNIKRLETRQTVFFFFFFFVRQKRHLTNEGTARNQTQVLDRKDVRVGLARS